MARIDKEGITYKETKVKNLLDKVTVKLTGNDSGKFTRIAKRYKQIDRLLGTLKEKREQLNEQVKEHVTDLFDAEDEILTRVVDTVSLTATLAKRVPASQKTEEDFDSDGFIEELYELFPDLIEQLDILKKKYTVIETIDVAEKSPALRVKIKESSDDDIFDKIEDYSDLVYQLIDRNLERFDHKLEALAQKIA